MDVFGSYSPGTLVVSSINASYGPGSISIDGLPQFALLQSAGVQKAVNFQAVPSLGGKTYCYTMGDRTGNVEVRAIVFEDTCGDGGGGATGFNNAVKAYDSNRASTAAKTVGVFIDGYSAQGYLVGLNITKDNPETKSASLILTIKVV